MNYAEIRNRVEALCSLEGWTTATPPARIAAAIERALEMFSFLGEYNREVQVLTAVVDQPEYSLLDDSRGGYKRVEQVLWGSTSLTLTDPVIMAVTVPGWAVAASGVPTAYWFTSPNVLRLYPTPNSVETVTVVGLRSEPPMVDASDEPIAPSVWHDAICRWAAALAGETSAATQEQEAKVQRWRMEGEAAAQACRGVQVEQRIRTVQRGAARNAYKRVYLS